MLNDVPWRQSTGLASPCGDASAGPVRGGTVASVASDYKPGTIVITAEDITAVLAPNLDPSSTLRQEILKTVQNSIDRDAETLRRLILGDSRTMDDCRQRFANQKCFDFQLQSAEEFREQPHVPLNPFGDPLDVRRYFQF